jgi:hypothetical protein
VYTWYGIMSWFSAANSRLERALGAYPFGFPWAVGFLLLMLGYALVFSISTDDTAGRTAVTSIINAAPAALMAVVIHRIIEHFAIGAPVLK